MKQNEPTAKVSSSSSLIELCRLDFQYIAVFFNAPLHSIIKASRVTDVNIYRDGNLQPSLSKLLNHFIHDGGEIQLCA